VADLVLPSTDVVDNSDVLDAPCSPYSPCPREQRQGIMDARKLRETHRREASERVASTTSWGGRHEQGRGGRRQRVTSPVIRLGPVLRRPPSPLRGRAQADGPIRFAPSAHPRTRAPTRFTSRPGAYGAGPSSRLDGVPRDLGFNDRAHVAYAQRAEGISGKAALGAADYSHYASTPIPRIKNIVHARTARPIIFGKVPRGISKARSSPRPFFLPKRTATTPSWQQPSWTVAPPSR
jgi:hypothetical protein